MKQAANLVLAALFLLHTSCAAQKVNQSNKFDPLYRTGEKLLLVNRYDARAVGLIRSLKIELDTVRQNASTEREADLVRLYASAAEAFDLSVRRFKSETSKVGMNPTSDDAQSYAALWRRAQEHLKAARGRYFALMGRQVRKPEYYDPPMKPQPKLPKYPWPR